MNVQAAIGGSVARGVRADEPAGEHQTGSRRTNVKHSCSNMKRSADTLRLALLLGLGLALVSSARAQSVVEATKTATLVVDVDGDGAVDAGDALRYHIVITNRGSTDATGVTFTDTIDPFTTIDPVSIRTTPVAVDDLYEAVGNVGIVVPAPGVLANDFDLDGQEPAAVPVAAGTTSNGGDYILGVDGALTYNPPPGFEGVDSFSYEMKDPDGFVDTAVVTLTVSGMIWFVDATAVCPCDGRLTSPFNDLAVSAGSFDVNATDQPGETIFVAAGLYNGGVTLLNDQRLIGDGSTGDLAAAARLELPPFSAALPVFSGVKPIITTGGDAVTLGQNNTVRGVTLVSSGAMGLLGTGVGLLTVAETNLSGIDILTGTLDVSLDTLSAGSSTVPGIRLADVTGRFSVTDPASTIDVANVPGVDIVGAPGGVSLNVTLALVRSVASVSHGIRLSNVAAGSLFECVHADVASSTSDGVALGNVQSSLVSFERLDIDNVFVNQRGLVASSVDILEVVGGAIDAGNRRAVDIDHSNLNVTLTSVTSVDGTSPGIDLDTTTGTFAVMGASADASGGVIASKFGADGTNDGIGILLNNATGVSLHHMQLTDFDNFAIRGTNVTDFDLFNTTIDGSSGTSTAREEGCVSFDNLHGSSFMVNNTIDGGMDSNLRVVNTTGTLNRLTLAGGTIGHNSATGNDAMFVEAQGAAVVNVTVSDMTFQGARGDLLQTNALDTSTMDVVLQDNTFSNTHAHTVSGGGGVTLSGDGIGDGITVTYDVSGTTAGSQIFGGARGNALTIYFASGSGAVSGFVRNNEVGVGGAPGHGSLSGDGILIGAGGSLTHHALVESNTVREVHGFAGLDVVANGASNVQLTMKNNTIAQIGGSAFAAAYLMVGGGALDTAVLCADIRNNTIDAHAVSSASAVHFDQISADAHYNLPGYSGSAHGESGSPQTGEASGSIMAHLLSRANSLSYASSVVYVVDATLVQGVTGTGPGCVQPQLVQAAMGVNAVASMDERVGLRRPKERVRGGAAAKAMERPSPHAEEEPDMDVAAVAVPVLPMAKTILAAALGGVATDGTVTVIVGTLPPGKSITISFDVVVDSPLPRPSPMQVCNQGKIFGDNFEAIPTDDPNTPAIDDPTCVPLQMQGACCLGATCSHGSLDDCRFAAGEYLGDDTTCDPNPCICGDLDGDNDVDDWDYQVFMASFGRRLGDGSGLYNPDADFNGDGLVIFADTGAWLQCYRAYLGDPAAMPALVSPGDYDADTDVDVTDYGIFFECTLGDDLLITIPCLAHFDANRSSTFDTFDFGAFQRARTAPVP